MQTNYTFAVGIGQIATVAAAGLLALAGCASMVSPGKELQTLKENEGVVFGSIVINVEKQPDKEPSLLYLPGPRAGNTKYSIRVVPHGSLSSFTNYWITVEPGQEFVFAKKLPAGSYSISEISRVGFGQLSFNLFRRFNVSPKQTTYIGRLTINFPYRFTRQSEWGTNVSDALEETLRHLEKQYEDATFLNTNKELMR